MKPLIILLIASAIPAILIKLITGSFDMKLAACLGMCVMLFFTGLSHFYFTKGMVMMIPHFLPFKNEIVYLTGILKMLLGILLILPFTQNYAAWGIILLFIIMLPANIKAAKEHIDYQKGNYKGLGPGYLWFRVPLQIFFIVWVFYSELS
ncbi:MAG: DoxX family protein [Chitinophagaceae bacterium]|nr:DoxX family protein [Chitinophagaceae bacterium]